MQKLSGRLDTILKYGIAAILIAVPLYPKFPFLQVPGIYVSIRIEDFLILAISVVWIIRNYSSLRAFLKNKIVRSIILFLVVGGIATLSGIVFLNTVEPIIGILQWGRRVEYFIGFFIAFTTIKSIRDVEFYIKCICIVLIITFGIGILQKYHNFPVITTQNSEYSKGVALRYVPGGHLASTFAGHYDLASYVILVSPILISMLFMQKESLKKLFNWNVVGTRVIIFIVIAMSFWMMVNAASRISAASYIISVCTSLLILRKYKYIPVVAAITTFFVFTTSNLFDRYQNILDVIKERLSFSIIKVVHAQEVNLPSVLGAVEDRSTSIRTNIEWPRAIRAFMKNPLIGTGYSSITLATDNDYLRALGETGILGVITFMMIFLRLGIDFLKRSWTSFFGKKEIDMRTAFLAGIIGAMPGIMLNAVFIDIFEASKFAISLWIILGMAVAILYAKDQKVN